MVLTSFEGTQKATDLKLNNLKKQDIILNIDTFFKIRD